MYEDRLLSQDVSARLTAGKWRDPQQGFVSMRYTKATGIAFKRTVPYISGDCKAIVMDSIIIYNLLFKFFYILKTSRM